MNTLELRGLIPATVTPFAEDLSIDFPALDAHLAATYASEGVTGVAVNGHLGELTALSISEQAAVVERAVALRGEGQLVVAGVAGISMADVVASASAVREAGADALLVLPPFDSRPLRRVVTHTPAVLEFFSVLEQEVGLPVIVFQYPEASGSAYTLETLEELVALDSVIAIKAATPNITAYTRLWDRLHDRVLILPAVDSPPLLPMIEHGSHGALIGISAIRPATWAKMIDSAQSGDYATARTIYRRFCLPLMDAVFQNQEPTTPVGDAASVKAALVALGEIPSARVRPFNVQITAERVGLIEAAVARATAFAQAAA